MKTHATASSVNFRLVRSRRRTLALLIRSDGSLEVRAPFKASTRVIQQFVAEKQEWIERKQRETSRFLPVGPLPVGQKQATQYQIEVRLGELALLGGLKQPSRVRVRDLRSRWGSCSARGAISINERCGSLPDDLRDYVLLHELCHLRHLNHSPAFWQLLRQVLPDADERRRRLRRYRLTNQSREVDI